MVLPVNVCKRFLNAFNQNNGGIDVNIQDQTTPIVDVYMNQAIDDTLTLASTMTLGSNTAEMTAGHGIVVGDTICMKEGPYFFQSRAAVVAGDTITLDTPCDFAFTSSAFVCRSKVEMNVLGSVASPQIFKIRPPSGTKWDVTRVIIKILDGTAMDDGLFGGITALQNGIVLRKKDGVYKNIFNVKSNGDFRARAYDVSYTDKAPAGLNGMAVRRTFAGPSKNGVTIRLDGDNAEELQMIIQDDLTGLSSFEVVVQGHVVD